MKQGEKGRALLTEVDVARNLKNTPFCLRRWRQEKRGLPWLKIGRLVRYRPEDVEAFINRNLQKIDSSESGEVTR